MKPIYWWLGISLSLGGVATLLPGRPWANAHPDVRGGGDWGFGGRDVDPISAGHDAMLRWSTHAMETEYLEWVRSL